MVGDVGVGPKVPGGPVLDEVAGVRAPVDQPPRPYFSSFDGLRGAACLIVVFGHLWIIVPDEQLRRTGPLYGLFRSGSLGVSMFFVLGSFLVTRSVIDERVRTGSFRIDRFWRRRIVRIGSQLSVLLVVVWLTSLLDGADHWSPATTWRSLLTIGTFTFNWSLINRPLDNREDLGHLWYLSVEQQFYVVFVVVLALMLRYRQVLIALLAVAIISVFVWRDHVYETRSWWDASLMTTTRADGLLLGACAALVLPYVRTLLRLARHVTFLCLLTLCVTVLISPQLSSEAPYLQSQGIVFVLTTAALVLAIAVARHPDGLAERLLSSRLLCLFGRVSFPLYLWHYPIFWAASRWGTGFGWLPRAIVSVAVVGVIVAAADRFIERPVNGRLRRQRTSRMVAASV